MQWRRVFVVIPAIVAAACGSHPSLPTAAVPEPAHVRVKVTTRGVDSVREVPFEDYVAATALSEFAPAAGDAGDVARMFEVQEIISRTYALSHLGRHAREGFDLCSTTHCQLYEPERLKTSRWTAALSEASARTARMVLWFGSAPAEALFHADCGGRTSAAQDVWGGIGQPYLASVRDDGPAEAAHASWEYTIDAAALQRALNADPRTRAGSRLDTVSVAVRDAAGRAQGIRIAGDSVRTVRGTDFREVMAGAFGPRAIRSTRFDVTLRSGRYVFTGTGFGHGVGVCQAGAFARIRAGAPVADVLRVYLPGTTIARLR